MELGTDLLGKRVVSDVAQEEVSECERLFTGKLESGRADELFPNERHQVRVDGATKAIRRELAHRADVKDLPLHGRQLQDRPLVVLEAVEPRREERLNRGRHRDHGEVGRRVPPPVLPAEQPVVDEHREHLLDEERIAFGRLFDPRAGLLGQGRMAEQVLDESVRLGVGERLEQDARRVQLAAAPVRAVVEELGPTDGDEQHRSVPRPFGDVLDKVEEGGFRPVHVVEDDHERAYPGVPLEQLAYGPESLFRAADAARQADGAPDSLRDQLRVGIVCDKPLDILNESHVHQLSDNLGDRPEGDPFAVGEAAARDDRCSLGEIRRNL